MVQASSSEAPVTQKSSMGRIVAVIAAVVLLYFLGRQAGEYVPRFAQWVESLGVWGPLVFIGGYILGVVAFLPGSLMTLAAGAIFGLVRGVLYVFVAASLGACAAFLVSRYLARQWVEQKLAGNPKFAAIDRAIAKEGRKIVFLLRMSPIFPFNMLNYALGLTTVRFVDYAVACLGMLPGTLLYVYYGKLAGDVAALAGGAAPEKGNEYYAIWIVGALATFLVSWVVTRTARKALAEVVE